MTKRKHYDCIIAWAKGKEIEYFDELTLRWEKIKNSPIWAEDVQYRVVTSMSELDDKDFAVRAPYIRRIAELETALTAVTKERDKSREAAIKEFLAYEKIDEESAKLRTTEWRPIETAPKDGTRFIGYEAEEGVAVMYTFTGLDGVFYWEAISQCIEMHPTHWMPLPEVPA